MTLLILLTLNIFYIQVSQKNKFWDKKQIYIFTVKNYGSYFNWNRIWYGRNRFFNFYLIQWKRDLCGLKRNWLIGSKAVEA